MSKESTFIESKGWKEKSSIGQGGQAPVKEVFRIADPEGPSFALKLLKSGKEKQAYHRFHKEIEALKKIKHPNVVKVVDHASDDSDTIHFYVMEYIPGVKPLKKIVGQADSPFYKDPFRSLEIYMQILQGLQACEKEGIVHRDLSLGNVIVTPDYERAVLIDFGCCYTGDHGCITLTDEAVGTVNYRAPECEAFQQEGVTSRADVYSAGKLLWSLVTNEAAFTREEAVFNAQALDKLLPDDPMTWHLHHVFEKTIRKNPNDRYRNVTEALAHSARVREIIDVGILPLEKMANERWCPMCRVGILLNAGAFEHDTLVDARTQTSGVRDDEIVSYMKRTGVPYQTWWLSTCTYCGFTSYFNEVIQKRNLERRKKLL